MQWRLAAIALLVGLSGCVDGHGEPYWTFSCQRYGTVDAGGEVVVTPTRAPSIDEPRIRADHPVLSAALDGCAGDGSSTLRGDEAREADDGLRHVQDGSFSWGEVRVAAMRYA